MAKKAKGKLRVGVVGAGGMGKTHMKAWMDLTEIAEVVAICDVDPQRADERAKEFNLPKAVYDLEALLEMKPDVVDLILPNRVHHDATVQALLGGANVICEKPLALDPKEVQSMINASKKSGKLLMVAHNQRFTAGAQALKKFIDAGELGDIYYAHGQWLRRRLVPARPTYYSKDFAGGGPIIDLACHMLDLLMFLSNKFNPVSVSAMAVCKMGRRKDVVGLWGQWDPKRFDVEDFGAALVRFGDGSMMMCEVSWLTNIVEPEVQKAILLGDQGGATWPDYKISRERNRQLYDMQLTQLPQQSSYVNELRAFCEAVSANRATSPIPPEQTLQLTSIIDAWYKSAELGREVAIKEVL